MLQITIYFNKLRRKSFFFYIKPTTSDALYHFLKHSSYTCTISSQFKELSLAFLVQTCWQWSFLISFYLRTSLLLVSKDNFTVYIFLLQQDFYSLLELKRYVPLSCGFYIFRWKAIIWISYLIHSVPFSSESF